jgi:hypothetical protein
MIAAVILLCYVTAAHAVGNSSIPLNTDGCWKHAKGRGVGSIPNSCGGGMDKSGLLCYPKCASGYTGLGPVCWQDCPSGWRDDGAFCFKPPAYGRGTGYSKESSCLKEFPYEGCEKWGALWYPQCGTGFYAFGCCVCSPVCPAGMTDIGISCAKHSYGRGWGSGLSCSEHMEYDAGLCYPFCDKGYYGVGPVCWQSCPKRVYKYDCAALCLKNDTACTSKVLGMVGDALQIVVDVIKLFLNPKTTARPMTTTVNPLMPTTPSSGAMSEFEQLILDVLNAATGYLYPFCPQM